MTNSISRRAVARGAAWSVPAIAVAGNAPALAVSAGCTSGPVTVNLGAGTRTILAVGSSGMPSKVQWAYTDTKTGVTVTIVTTAIGSTILGHRTAYAVDSYVDSDLMYDGTGFNIQHVTRSGSAPGTGGEGESVAISFTRKGAPVTVTNFAMNIDDIDTKSGNWTDGVVLTSGAVAAAKAANIDGNGTSGAATYTSGPWHNAYTTPGTNSSTDRLTLTAPSITSLGFDYINVPKVNGMASAGTNADQNIQLTGMTFQAPAC